MEWKFGHDVRTSIPFGAASRPPRERRGERRDEERERERAAGARQALGLRERGRVNNFAVMKILMTAKPLGRQTCARVSGRGTTPKSFEFKGLRRCCTRELREPEMKVWNWLQDVTNSRPSSRPSSASRRELRVRQSASRAASLRLSGPVRLSEPPLV